MDRLQQRALCALERREGEFSLLLDESFDIVWQSESTVEHLGVDDARGRNATEFVHVDDLGLVADTMARSIELVEHRGLDPSVAPEASQIRIRSADGRWLAFDATTFNYLDDPEVRAVLCVCRRTRDRADLSRTIELLASGTPVDELMPVIVRLAEHSMGGGRVGAAVAWTNGERTEVVTSHQHPPLDRRLADVARTVWTQDIREPTVITDLDDPILGEAGPIAAAEGFRGAFIMPIAAPGSSSVIASMVAWGTSTVDFHASDQTQVHVALRLAALAIADHRTKLALRWAASHDPLTGLANRAEFSRLLDDAADRPLVLLYIDLDDFKPINDQHGHPTGDLVLVEVAQRIAATIGPRDVVGRLGGDEFAVLCPDTDDPDHGRQLGQRIIARLGAPIRAADIDLHVGASVGVAIGAHPLIPSVLAARADSALYEAKRSGKNTVRLADQH